MKEQHFSLTQENSDYEELIYLRKILLLRFIHVLFAFGVSCIFLFVEPVYEFTESRIYLTVGLKVSLIPIAIILFKVDRVGGSLILSTIFGILFTVGLGAMLGSLFSLYWKPITAFVLLSAFVIVHFALFLYPAFEKNVYNVTKGLLWILELTIVNFMIEICYLSYKSFYLLIIAFVFGMFGVFSVYHAKMISQGKFRVIPRERYVLGALSVYVDFTLIKLFIIQKCCKKRKEDEEQHRFVKE